jgi:hypothetical protein
LPWRTSAAAACSRMKMWHGSSERRKRGQVYLMRLRQQTGKQGAGLLNAPG